MDKKFSARIKTNTAKLVTGKVDQPRRRVLVTGAMALVAALPGFAKNAASDSCTASFKTPLGDDVTRSQVRTLWMCDEQTPSLSYLRFSAQRSHVRRIHTSEIERLLASPPEAGANLQIVTEGNTAETLQSLLGRSGHTALAKLVLLDPSAPTPALTQELLGLRGTVDILIMVSAQNPSVWHSQKALHETLVGSDMVLLDPPSDSGSASDAIVSTLGDFLGA